MRLGRAWSSPPWVALGYSAAFGLTTAYLRSRPVEVQDAWLQALSTNLVNLADHPVRVLVGSAFVTEEGGIASWLVLACVGMAAAGEALGNGRLVVVLTASQVVGSLVSESVLDHRIRAGQALLDDRLMIDVGPSYVVAAALTLGMLTGSNLGRALSGIGFALLAPHLFGGLGRLEVSAVGHVVAIGTALLLGPPLVRDRRARHPQTLARTLPGWSSKSP